MVGEQSFGKGLVQTVSGLSENTGLALTTARYYTPSGRLIQRDYKDISLYDYLYNHKNPAPTEVKLTDSGRQVTGGGGITPDVAVAPAKLNPFQESLLRHEVFFAYQGGVGGFTTYFLGTKPEITKDFVAGDNAMKTFRAYLDKEKIPYTEDDIAQNLSWIKREIRKEAFISVFGLTEGYKVDLEDDVQLQKAVESLPQARALYENARKIIAQRNAGSGVAAAIVTATFTSFKFYGEAAFGILADALLKSHEFRGRLAQLGERIVRNDEAGGSNPLPSTKFLWHTVHSPEPDARFRYGSAFRMRNLVHFSPALRGFCLFSFVALSLVAGCGKKGADPQTPAGTGQPALRNDHLGRQQISSRRVQRVSLVRVRQSRQTDEWNRSRHAIYRQNRCGRPDVFVLCHVR